MGEPRIWFMYDCHAFARVGSPGVDSTDEMKARSRELFAEDGCGMLGGRGVGVEGLRLHGSRQPDGTYGVTDAALDSFFNSVDERINWLCRG